MLGKQPALTGSRPPLPTAAPAVFRFRPRGSRASAVCRWRPVVKPNVLRMADAVMHAATPAVENGPPLLVGGQQEQAGEAAAEFLECGLLSPVSLSSIARVHLFALACTFFAVVLHRWRTVAGMRATACASRRRLSQCRPARTDRFLLRPARLSVALSTRFMVQ